MFLLLLVVPAEQLADHAGQRPGQRGLDEERLRGEEAEKRFLQARGAVDLLIEVGEEELAYEPWPRRACAGGCWRRPWSIIRTSSPTPRRSFEPDGTDRGQETPREGARRSFGPGGGGPIDPALRVAGASRPRLGRRPAAAQAGIAANFSSGGWIRCTTSSILLSRAASGSWNCADQRPSHAATLTPFQLQRLAQMTLQLQGPRAFSQPEVIAKLHLSDAQRQAIRQIEMDAFASAGLGPTSRHRNRRRTISTKKCCNRR